MTLSLYAKIAEIAERVKAQRNRMTNEAVTCSVSVKPFLRALGHDDEDARQVFPEFGADPKWSGGKTVDYAILSNDKPVFLVEAKSATVNLGATQWEQLYQYLNATDARYGILTNGLIYEFYSDRKKVNIMDRKPFLTIDLLNLDEQQVADLNPFLRSNFPPECHHDDMPPPDSSPDTFEYPIHVHIKGQRLEGMLVIDRVMNWHKQLILVRFMGELMAHTSAKSKAIQSIDPNGKSPVGAWTFWRFEHPVSGEDLPISEICLDVQNKGDLRKQLWERICSPNPTSDAIPVYGYYQGHRLEAEMLLTGLVNGFSAGSGCIRFAGKITWAKEAAIEAIRSINPDYSPMGKNPNGLSFWHVVDPADDSEHKLVDLSTHVNAPDDALRHRLLNMS